MTRAITFRTGPIERGINKVLDAYQNYQLTGRGNETAKVQTAINDASESGRILLLPPFLITVDTLVIPQRGVQIEGQIGTLGAENGVPISGFQSSGVNAPIILINTLTRRSTFHNITVRGTQGGSNQHGILLEQNHGISDIRLEGVYADFCGGAGIKTGVAAFSLVMRNCFSTNCLGSLYDIDALNSPCVYLDNCYAGISTTGQYGFYIRRGFVYLLNCNGLDAGESWIRVGDSSIGTATVVLDHCNLESFTVNGMLVDFLSNFIIRGGTSFVSAPSVAVRAIDCVETTGLSKIDSETSFQLGAGATWVNSQPIHLFHGIVNVPAGINPQAGATSIYEFRNSEDGRNEPLANQHTRLPTVLVTAATYTEERVTPGYIGVNRSGAVTVSLFDPQSNECYEGRVVTIKDESGNASVNNITINTVNARNINGAGSVTINTNYGFVQVVRRSNQYWTI